MPNQQCASDVTASSLAAMDRTAKHSLWQAAKMMQGISLVEFLRMATYAYLHPSKAWMEWLGTGLHVETKRWRDG